MATDNRTRPAVSKMEGTTRRNYDRLARKLGGSPPAPAASAPPPPVATLQGAARKNYDRLAQKLGVSGAPAAPQTPAATAAPPAPRAPALLSSAQALALAGGLMDLDFNDFETEARRLLTTGQARVLKALAASRPNFEQDLGAIQKWARCSYAAYLAKEMTDDARWQVARMLNDRLLLWVETRSDRLAEELRIIRREIGF